MNENSYLNPNNIRSQSDAAIRNLVKDNNMLQVAEASLNNFINDREIKGEAFNALKQQISDYKKVLSAIRSANDSDIADYRTLKTSVGSEILDGAKIISQQNVAISSRDENRRIANEYYGKSRDTQYLWMEFYYNCQKSHYNRLAEADQELYEAWYKKETEYDRIEVATRPLFTASGQTRAAAKKALNNISNAFSNGTYLPDMKAEWRSELSASYLERVLAVSEDGEITVKMSQVKKILGKDAEYITDEEYQALALAYIMADEEDLAVFLQYMTKDRTDCDYTVIQEITGYSANIINEDYSEWTADQEKLNGIIGNVGGYSEGTLHMIQEYRAAGDDDSALGCILQRNEIVQRMTLLSTFYYIGKFRGGYKDEYPTITVTEDEKQGLTLEFCEFRNVGSDLAPTMNTLGKSTVTVSSTVNGEFIDNKEIDIAEYSMLCRFGTYSAASEAAGFTYDEVTGMIIDEAIDELADHVVAKTGKKAVGEAIGYIPVVGDIAGFAIESVMDEEQAKQDAESIKMQFSMVKAAEIYSEFDCSVNFVEFDTKDMKEHAIYPHAGEQTDAKIAAINEELGEVLTNDLTRDIVLINPVNVWELEQEISNRLDLREIYENIISGKNIME